MTTWAQLLADIRTDIKDTVAVKKFSDAALYLYTKDAIRDYSQYFPQRCSATLTATAGAYTLPVDYVGGEEVECPEGSFLEKRFARPGYKYTVTGEPTAYYLEGGALTLNGTPAVGSTVVLTYDSIHPLPSAETDLTFTFTFPMGDEELIRLYVKAKTAEQLRTNQASLDRFKMGSGARDDNPLNPEVRDLMMDYRMKIAERFGGGVVYLYVQRRL
jgi:hypothetical protein